jgi:hypothetical protein
MAVYPHHCPHIPFMKPRRKLGNGNKSVSTVVDELLIAIDATNQSISFSLHLPRFPCFLRVTVQSSRRFASPGAFRDAAQPVCQFKPKIIRIMATTLDYMLLVVSQRPHACMDHVRWPRFLEVRSYNSCYDVAVICLMKFSLLKTRITA